MFFLNKTLKKVGAVALCIFLCVVIIGEVTVKSKAAFAVGGKLKPIYSVDTDEKKIAISFDAAWGSDNTRKIMDILDSYSVKATFFLVGFWIDKNAELVKEIYNRGFEIGNHSLNHPEMSKLTKEQMQKEVQSVNDKVYELTGYTPTVFRPPYGDYNDTLISLLREMNVDAVQWSIDSLDWKELGRNELIKRVTNKYGAGDIILFHNNAKYTPSALPEILEQIINDGYTVCSVSELISKGNTNIDIFGVQRSAN